MHDEPTDQPDPDTGESDGAVDTVAAEHAATNLAGQNLAHSVERVWPSVSDRVVLAALLAVVALPFVVSAAVLATTSWTPAGDQALQILRIDQVGTSRTPLLGAWSRYGWNHPGPWPSYVLAPFTWVFGNVGALIGTLTVNLASLGLAVVVARRRGGLAAAGLVALCGLLIGFGQGPTMLMDLWNPFVGVFPLYALVVVAWSIGERDWAVLPFAVALGSFSVQAHIGYLPVVAGVCIAAGLVAARSPQPMPTHPDRRTGRTAWQRPLLWALGVGVVVWLPPLIDQLGGNANVSKLVRYALESPEPSVGWSVAWKIFAAELGVPGAWLTGREFNLFSSSDSAIGAVVIVLAAATLGVAAFRAHAPSAVRLAVVTLGATATAFVASSRITGFPFDYLLAWWWVLGASLWLSIGWSTWNLLHRLRPRAATSMTRVVLAAAVVVALGLTVRSASADLPVAQQSATVAALIEQVEPRLVDGDSYLVEWRDSEGFGYVGIGVFAALSDLGVDVTVSTDEAMASFESWQRSADADHRLIVSTRDDDREFPPPPSSVLVARYDPLGPDDRAEADALWSTISEQGGDAAISPGLVQSSLGRDLLLSSGVDPRVLDRFIELWSAGPAFVVYVATGTTGGV